MRRSSVSLSSIEKKQQKENPIPENETLGSAPEIHMNWPEGVKEPFVGLVINEENLGNNASWPKFERFLKVNHIPYEPYDITRSDFINTAQRYDVIVWRTETEYTRHWEALDKIEIIQNHLNKMVLPSSESVWMDEDKLREQYLFEVYGLPTIKTFVSQSKTEVMKYIENCSYPFVSKDRTCAHGNCVFLIKNKTQAKTLCEKIFSSGKETYVSYLRQKDYVYFQEFVPNYGYDLRIVMVGNSYFGYYRYPREGDFRGSGSHIIEKKSCRSM